MPMVLVEVGKYVRTERADLGSWLVEYALNLEVVSLKN
jgi:hypothetical protein